MELHEIVMKLIGKVDPVGETHEDNERFENLKVLTKLVNDLLCDIDRIATTNKDRYEYSLQRAGKFCDAFFKNIGIVK